VEKDSKLTAIFFLTYVVYGLFYLFDGHFDFVVPYPLIILFVPLLCIIFFVMSIKRGESMFFLFFPLIAIQTVMESMDSGADYGWLGYLSGFSALIFVASNIIHLKSWGKYKWLPIASFVSLLGCFSSYFIRIEFLIYPMVLLLIFTLISLILNMNKFEIPPVLKRQFLVICFMCGLMVTTLIAILTT
jgi:hypothetical protein